MGSKPPPPEDVEMYQPPFSFTSSPSFKKTTILQKVFSVRVLLICSFAFLVLFMCGVMYGIIAYRYQYNKKISY